MFPLYNADPVQLSWIIKDKLPRAKYLQDQIHDIKPCPSEHLGHLKERISVHRGKFTSSIHNRIVTLFLEVGYKTGRILFIIEWFWIFVPTFLGMEDCSWTLLLPLSVTCYLLHVFVSLLVLRRVNRSEPRMFRRACLCLWHSTGHKPERQGAASLLLKQRPQWGAANQAGLRDDGEEALLRTREAKQSLLRFKKPEAWLRLKWEAWFSNRMDTDNRGGNVISLSFLFCLIQ